MTVVADDDVAACQESVADSDFVAGGDMVIFPYDTMVSDSDGGIGEFLLSETHPAAQNGVRLYLGIIPYGHVFL